MNPHLQYTWYLARHKWFVFLGGLKTGAPLWRLVVHDWSKFTRAEWSPYVDNFYRPSRSAGHRALMEHNFDVAWLHHQHKNPHHWQHWVLREDDGQTKFLEMPNHFVQEMVADWMGAGRAITGKWDAPAWYLKNKDKIQLSTSTRMYVEYLLGLRKQELED